MEELRRVDIVYFLSRKGSIEQPHLIRLHHLSHGIRLRDVKRWLGEVRGKDMADSFSWSYKKRYKTGYVWQDLLDDELITPFSGSEYVLKGSEISSSIKLPGTDVSCTRKNDQPSCLQEDQKALDKSHNSSSVRVSEKSSPEIEKSSQTFSSETSTVLTEDSIKLEMNSITSSYGATEREQRLQPSFKDDQRDPSSPSCSTNKDKKTGKKSGVNETKSSTSSSKSKKGESTSSSPSSSILRNLITCGGVHTSDSAVVPMNKQKKPFSNMCSCDPREIHSPLSAEICKRDMFGGSQSQRVLGTPNWTQHQSSGRKSFDGVRPDSSRAAAYKPVNGPSCSQCGKPFRPEKMHSHMKICKGMKVAMSKATIEKASSQVPVDSRTRAHFSGRLLAHRLS